MMFDWLFMHSDVFSWYSGQRRAGLWNRTCSLWRESIVFLLETRSPVAQAGFKLTR